MSHARASWRATVHAVHERCGAPDGAAGRPPAPYSPASKPATSDSTTSIQASCPSTPPRGRPPPGSELPLETSLGDLDLMQWVPGVDADHAYEELASRAPYRHRRHRPARLLARRSAEDEASRWSPARPGRPREAVRARRRVSGAARPRRCPRTHSKAQTATVLEGRQKVRQKIAEAPKGL